MSVLLRSMLVLSVAGLLMVGCGKKEEAAPVKAVPAPAVVAVPAVVEAPVEKASGGGYEPTAEERVPGITIDVTAPAAEAAPAEGAPAADAAPAAK